MKTNKIIHLKPPIIVRELAKQIEIQPFQLIHDLMDMNVFANRNQTITPEVASAISKKYGYTLVLT
jgi:translation initiation factor IF-2